MFHGRNAEDNARSATLYAATVVAIGIVYSTLLIGSQYCLGNWSGGLGGHWIIFVVSVVPCLQLANATLDALLPFRRQACQRDRMNYANGVPLSATTLVVIPVVLSESNVADIATRLHAHFLENREDNIYFCALTDLPDSTEPHRSDDLVVEVLASHIARLNSACSSKADEPFLLLHRHRTWNPIDQCWMGWERKRGKLEELNKIILGQPAISRSLCTKEHSWFKKVKYVFTVDFDTEMTNGVVRQLVEIIDHPANSIDAVDTGERPHLRFAIVQPKVQLSRFAGKRSMYEASAEVGVWLNDASGRSSASQWVSESAFCGKGLYCVADVSKVTSRWIPENLVLSHDVVEGGLARVMYVKDVSIFESSPRNYLCDMMRWHRWMRGDWQNIIWYLKFRPLFNSAKTELSPRRAAFSTYTKWRILENVFRNISPTLLLILIVLGWGTFPRASLWSADILVVAMLPLILRFISSHFCAAQSNEVTKTVGERPPLHCLLLGIFQSVTFFSTLPISSVISVDAIARSSWRVLVSRKKILEWQPSGTIKRFERLSGWRLVLMSAVLIGSLVLLASRAGGVMRLISYPFAALWCCAPLQIWISSLSFSLRTRKMSETRV